MAAKRENAKESGDHGSAGGSVFAVAVGLSHAHVSGSWYYKVGRQSERENCNGGRKGALESRFRSSAATAVERVCGAQRAEWAMGSIL